MTLGAHLKREKAKRKIMLSAFFRIRFQSEKISEREKSKYSITCITFIKCSIVNTKFIICFSYSFSLFCFVLQNEKETSM